MCPSPENSAPAQGGPPPSAASAGQGAPPPGAGSPPGGGSDSAGDFKFSVLRKFGGTYLKGHVGMIIAYVIGHLLVQTILPQQAAVFMGKLTNHFASGGSAANAPTVGGFNLLTTYGFWISFTVALLIGKFGFQLLIAKLDGAITNGVKADLFSKLLRQPPGFFHKNDSDRLTMIVNQYANQMAGALRRLLIEPVLQIVAIAVIGFTIYQALLSLTAGPAVFTILGFNGVWVMFGITVIFALTSPWIVNKMGKFLQADTTAVQEQHLSLATLVGGALKAPEEIQAMRAEPVFQSKLVKLTLHKDHLSNFQRQKMLPLSVDLFQ